VAYNNSDSLSRVKYTLSQDTIKVNNTLFSNHLLKTQHDFPILRNNNSLYWQSSVLLFVFALYVILKMSEDKKMTKVFVSTFSFQESKQLYREDYKLTKRLPVFLSIGYVLVLSFFMLFTNNYFGLIFQNYSEIQQYILFAVIVLMIYTVKYIVNSFFSVIYKQKELTKEYFLNAFTISHTLGIVLFPMVLGLYFTKYSPEIFLYPALIISVSFYLIKLYRSFIISVIEQNVGILYIFLYLCALEILPILVLIKFLLVNF
jgi:hypothetical protein